MIYHEGEVEKYQGRVRELTAERKSLNIVLKNMKVLFERNTLDLNREEKKLMDAIKQSKKYL